MMIISGLRCATDDILDEKQHLNFVEWSFGKNFCVEQDFCQLALSWKNCHPNDPLNFSEHPFQCIRKMIYLWRLKSLK